MALPKFTFLLPCLLGAAGLFVARQSGDGSAGFYAATVLTAIVYATTWWLMGSRNAFAGPGKAADIARGVAIGAALAAIFVAGAVIVSRIPLLAEPVGQLLATTEKGGLAPTLLVLILNGIGEELVYRDALPRQLRVHGLLHHTTSMSAVSLALYCLVTAAMGVWLLILAAAVIGAVAHYEAFRSGRLYSSISLHLTWSSGMLFLLPLFFR